MIVIKDLIKCYVISLNFTHPEDLYFNFRAENNGYTYNLDHAEISYQQTIIKGKYFYIVPVKEIEKISEVRTGFLGWWKNVVVRNNEANRKILGIELGDLNPSGLSRVPQPIEVLRNILGGIYE